MDNRTAVLAVAGAFALGAVGTNALADDNEGAERVEPVKVTQEDRRAGDRDDRRDDRDDRTRGEPARGDDDDVDVEPRDDDEGDGDSDSAAAAAGGVSASDAAAAPVPTPEPAPVYDDYASDYGDT